MQHIIAENGGKGKMTYTGTHRAVKTMQRTAAGYRTQARQKSRQKRIRAAIRTAAGWTTTIMFILVLGKAGAFDCGAAWEEIFPSTFIYMAIAVVAFHGWEAFGGNKLYNNNRYNMETEK